MNDFIKFPHTPHLFDPSGSISRGDKLLSQADAKPFYTTPVVIEEKVDGANIGFSLSPDGSILVQNRGNYITASSHPQFAKLYNWILAHEEALFDLLLPDRMLFGEWCYAKHSIHYESLPDWFLAFDIYDRHAGKFISQERRHELLSPFRIFEVPLIGTQQVAKHDLERMLTKKSALYDGPLEGLYLRIEEESGFLAQRAKVVRPDFVQSIDVHWSKSTLITNSLQNRENN